MPTAQRPDLARLGHNFLGRAARDRYSFSRVIRCLDHGPSWRACCACDTGELLLQQKSDAHRSKVSHPCLHQHTARCFIHVGFNPSVHRRSLRCVPVSSKRADRWAALRDLDLPFISVMPSVWFHALPWFPAELEGFATRSVPVQPLILLKSVTAEACVPRRVPCQCDGRRVQLAGCPRLWPKSQAQGCADQRKGPMRLCFFEGNVPFWND